MAGNRPEITAAPQDWELCKENFQPIKAGRKPAGLKDPIAISGSASLEEQRQAHIAAMEKYSGDDPLELWLSYIKWTQDTFKTGGHKAEFLALLERCTRELQGNERYRNDVRYLRVWIQYADCLPDPSDVFSFLKDHGIGQELSLFYIAHATYLEQQGNYSAADHTYQQGINRLAAPLDRLQAKYKDFEHRMARRIQRKAQQQQAAGEEPAHPERQSLSVLGGRGSRRTGGLPSQKRKAVATPGKANAPAGGGLAIFVDEEFGGPAASAPAALHGAGTSSSASIGAGGAGPAWSALPSFEQARKENMQKAASWAGQKIKQKPVVSAPPAPTLDIPLDPEFEAQEQEAVRRAALAAAQQGTLRQRLERGGIEEQLAHDPLRLHRGEPAQVPAQAPEAAKPAPAPREQVFGCDTAGLQDAAGEDVSFEEVRAIRWLENNHLPVTRVIEPQGFQAVDAPNVAALKVQQKAPGPTPFDQPAADSLAAVAAGDVTMNTRSAFEAVNAVFGGGFGAFSSGEDAAALDPTMTIATKDAFAAINSMFKGSFMATEPSSSTLDQTVTLSTKAAFEALNAAFGGSGNAAASQAEGAATAGPKPSGLLVRKDTSLLSDGGSVAVAAAEAVRTVDDPFGGLCIREDTIFINPRDACPPSTSPTGGLSIREDTVFIRQESAGGCAPSSGLDIREDTVFFSKDEAVSMPQGGGGLNIREDTVFISNAATGPTPFSALAGEITAPLVVGDDEDTENVAPAGAASKWGFVPGDDDTLVFGGSALGNGARPAFGPQHSAGLTADLADLELSGPAAGEVDSKWSLDLDNDENAMPAGCADSLHADRDVHSPTAAATALRTMPLEQRTIRGIEVQEDLEAEGTLVEASQHADGPNADVFFVPEDGGAIDPPAPSPLELIDPFTAQFQGHVLSMLDPPVAEWPGVASLHTGEEEAAALSAFKRARTGIQSVTLAGRMFQVHRSIGAGAYATVYEATDDAGSTVALKVESPPCPWEWYICRVVAGRVPEASRPAFVNPSALFLGAQASVLEMPCSRRGSLQELLNVFLARGQRPEEVIVARLAALLLRALGDLHAARVLHNDIKPDNVLVSLVGPAEAGDENAAPVLGLQLIDFGRSVDLELLPPGAALFGDSGTDAFRCVEMREGQPWVWQADTYGAAGVLHCLLLGEYMDVERVVDTSTGASSLRIKSQLRRYWQTGMWAQAFSTLLNHWSLDTESPPPWHALAKTFEEWLGSSRELQRKERTELSKLAALLPTM